MHPRKCEEQVQTMKNRSSVPEFTHKRNADGSLDSICNNCFTRVAVKSQHSELRHLEAVHSCAGFDLGHILRPAVTEKRVQ